MYTLTCSRCKTVFERRQIREGSKHFFCSRECYDEARQEVKPDKKLSGLTRWASVEITCQQCGQAKSIRPSYKSKSQNHFCSQSCYLTWYKNQDTSGKMNEMRISKNNSAIAKKWCPGFVGDGYNQERHEVLLTEFPTYRSSVHRHKSNGKKKRLRIYICKKCHSARAREYFNTRYYPEHRAKIIAAVIGRRKTDS